MRAVAEEIRGVRVAALARAREADILAAGKALAGAARPVIHTFLATSGIHLKYKLKLTPEEALRQAVEGVRLARNLAPEVEFSAEDASRSDGGNTPRVREDDSRADRRTRIQRAAAVSRFARARSRRLSRRLLSSREVISWRVWLSSVAVSPVSRQHIVSKN